MIPFWLKVKGKVKTLGEESPRPPLFFNKFIKKKGWGAVHRHPRSWLLLIALGLQVSVKMMAEPPTASIRDFGPPPSQAWLRLSFLGDPITQAVVWMLWLQTFDDQAGVVIPFKQMNFTHLTAWLEQILALDPRFEYPLLAAVRVYGFVQDQDKQRLMIDFVHRAFFADPKHRWQWLAFAAIQAYHRLGDTQKASQILEDLEKSVISQQLPFWVLGLHARILTDHHEFDSARALMEGLRQHESLTENQKMAMENWLDKLMEIENYQK